MVAAGGRSGSGATHPLKIIANIFISFIGAGVLGLPYAFKEAGLAEGILIMVTVGYVSIQAMFLIIDCKYLLLRKRSPGNGTVKSYLKSNVAVKEGSVELKLPLLNDHDADDDDDDKIVIDTSHEITYGDLGFYAFGTKGRWLVDGTVVVSQIGFCCAYLIFISENLSTYISGVTTAQWLVIFLPLLYLLCLLRKLEKLAIFSVFAQVSTIMAFAVVFWFDFEHYHVMKRFHPREFSVKGFPFFFAIAIYCYEGAGMILSLENSLAEHVRPKFKLYFSRTMLCVTGLYVVFGCSGYISFGPETEDIITLNLPPSDGVIDFAMIVKCCLCFSLFFTYPLMIFPVVTIIEKRFPAISSSVARGNGLRLLLVAISGLVVVLIPDFANLMAIIGGTCCTLLAFILPGLFHLKLRRRSLTPREKYFDIFLICLGLLGAVIATSDAISRMSKEVEVPALPVEGLTPMHQSHTSISWHVATPAINDTLSSNGTLPSSTALPSNGTLPSNATVLSNLSLGGGPVPVNGSLLDRTVSTSVLPAASGVVQSTAGPLLEPANGTVLPAVS